MRRAHSLPIALFAATMLAGAAAAQTPQPAVRQDLRQLSWPGRTTAAASPTATSRTDLRRANLVIPHGGFSAVEAAPPPAPPASAPRRTLTPANAWLRPATPPPAPVAAAPIRSEVAETAAPPPARPVATPEYLPDQGRRGQRAPADIVYAAPPEPAPAETAVVPDQPADPMAPRRDAPIFRIQQAAPPLSPPAEAPAPDAAPRDQAALRPHYVAEVTNTGERPPQQGARYYSVHRQNGRQPDALSMPEPTYVDALAITMTQTPASQDLAQPDQGPTLIRDNQGRTRPAPAASDGDHQ